MATSKSKQRAFILWMTTFSNDDDEVVRDTNLEQLNSLLGKGWRVVHSSPMSGHGQDDDETRCLVILEGG